MRLLTLVLFLFSVSPMLAQKYMTRGAEVSFLSDTEAIEVVAAINNQVGAVIDLSNGDLAFQVQMRAFHFKIALMEEHFNENYVESDRFPKATFRGRFVDLLLPNLLTEQELSVKGVMDLHGVQKEMTFPVLVKWEDGSLVGTSSFDLRCSDFNIEIPKIVSDKISNEIQVTVKALLTKL
ncbi:MAG: YceI family protein [Flavobacteriales bacterium]|nr:YceI family protein [Flavobacteriales bacterium]